MPKKNATPKIPNYLATATMLYGDSLGAKRASDLLGAMQTFAELPADEQRFVLAHLAYLGIEAQAANQRVLTQIRDLLDEVAEQVSVGLDSALPADEPPPDAVPAAPGELTLPAVAEPKPDDGGAS